MGNGGLRFLPVATCNYIHRFTITPLLEPITPLRTKQELEPKIIVSIGTDEGWPMRWDWRGSG
jgi:hypothetical protein